MLIVNFHDVVAGPLDVFDREASPRLTTEQFSRAIDRLSERFRWISLDTLVERLQHGPEADHYSAAVTFDDGHRGAVVNALPILAERVIPASMFAVTGRLVDDPPLLHFEELEIAFRITRVRRLDLDLLRRAPRNLATDAERARCLGLVKRDLKALPERERSCAQQRLLERLEVAPEDCREAARGDERYSAATPAELAALQAAGWTIGAHTRTHRSVSALDAGELHSEIAGSRDDLRAFGFAAEAFAYPYGGNAHIGEAAPQVVRDAGYSCALTMIAGGNGPGTDPFALRRVDIRDVLPYLPEAG